MIVNGWQFLVNILCIVLVYAVSQGIVEIEPITQLVYQEAPVWDYNEWEENFYLAFHAYDYVSYTFLGVSAFISLQGLLGVYCFSGCIALFTAWWYVICGVASLIVFGWGGIGLLYMAFLAYPNVMFRQELREGLMQPQTYYLHERYVCGCLMNPYYDDPFQPRPTIKQAIEKRMGLFSTRSQH